MYIYCCIFDCDVLVDGGELLWRSNSCGGGGGGFVRIDWEVGNGDGGDEEYKNDFGESGDECFFVVIVVNGEFVVDFVLFGVFVFVFF